VSDRALYADSSALVKLIVEEPETDALEAAVAGRELVASELALAEVPRAIRRLSADAPAAKRIALRRGVEGVLGGLALLPVGRDVLLRAGAFDEPFLRALDAIHVASALSIAAELEALISYDARQLEMARVAGLPVLSPA
jgi:predicted nucleic acid-binding protein